MTSKNQQQTQINVLAKQIANQVLNCSFTLPSIKEYLTLLSIQQKKYSDFSYEGNGPFTLVLKAKKNGREDVVLKAIECNEDSKDIESMKKGYAILKELTQSDYFVAVQYQFFLAERGEHHDSSSSEANKGFFVQEMDLCEGTLSEILQKYQQDKNYPSESQKETLVIQILDAVNLLHQRQVAHGHISTSTILVSKTKKYPLILKLRNLGHIQPVSLKNSNQSSENNETQSEETPEQKARVEIVEQDLFSLGLVILELDNLETLDFSKVTDIELKSLKEGDILLNHKINRDSTLYKIACQLLSSSKNKEIKCNAKSVLLQLLNKSEEYSKIPLFSIILKNTVNFISLQLPRTFMSQQHHFKGAESTKLNKLMSQFNTKAQDCKQLTTDLLKTALKTMLEWEDFGEIYDLIGIGSSSVVFGAYNIKANRKCALKVSLCQNKADTIRQIGIMRICSSPYIAQFYDARFFEDTNGNEFVVYELELCKYSLVHHLELQRISGEYSEQQKQSLMLQILDSVNYLQSNNVIHRNIQLDSFLVSENDQGKDIVKLSNFTHAKKPYFDDSMCEQQQKISKLRIESLMYFAPEIWEAHNSTTELSDSFSVGLCLILLDNYLVFSEEQLADKFASFTQAFGDLVQDKKIPINTKSNVYNTAKKFLMYLPKHRKSVKDVVSQWKQVYCQATDESSAEEYVFLNCSGSSAFNFLKSLSETFHSFSTPPKILNLTTLTLEMNSYSISGMGDSSLLQPLSNLINLNKISLSFNNSAVGDTEAQYILTPLANLINLTDISVSLNDNQIGELGAQLLLAPLANLKNLVNFSLGLRSNPICELGSQCLLTHLSSLFKLSSISLDLYYTHMRDKGGQSLLSPLKHLTNLSSIWLDLDSALISEIGSQSLLVPLTSLTNLSSLWLNYKSNYLGNLGAEYLFAPLANLKNLQSIFFNACVNLIENSQPEFILAPLANLSNLKSLSLNFDHNNLNKNAAQVLLRPLSNIQNLQNLQITLNSNQIGNSGAEYLLQPLSNLTNMQSISVTATYNQIRDPGAEVILLPLQNLVNLRNVLINLNGNGICQVGAQKILTPLSELINLQSISVNLGANSIGDVGASYLLDPLANLTNLASVYINLNCSSLKDQGAEFLLSKFSNLTSLQCIDLDLSANNIGLTGVQYLLLPLKDLKNIKNIQLSLCQSKIKEDGAQVLLTPIENFMNLSDLTLNLGYCGIGDGAQSLLSPIANLTSLVNLSLSLYRNEIGGIGAKQLLSPLANLVSIVNLDVILEYNQIGDIGAASLLSPISKLVNIQNLKVELHDNKIGDDGASALLSPIANLVQLENLFIQLYGNRNIGDIGAQNILVPLKNLENLSTFSLNLHGSSLGPKGAEHLLVPLKNLITLSELTVNLNQNSIGPIGAQHLLSPISELTNLTRLSLELVNDQILNSGAQSLLAPIANLINLKSISLELTQNTINDEGAKELFTPISKLLNLRSFSVYLESNQIGSIGAQSLLSCLTCLEYLSYLLLSLRYNKNPVKVDIQHLLHKIFTKKLKDINVWEEQI